MRSKMGRPCAWKDAPEALRTSPTGGTPGLGRPCAVLS